MATIFRTENAKYARPTDDPAWKKNGAHAGNGPNRIRYVDTPQGRAIEFRVDGNGQDVVFGTINADRSEVMHERIFHEGDEIVLATQANLKDYRSSGGQWHVCLYDCHDDKPGGTQSPIMDYVENDIQVGVRTWGGPVSSNGWTGTIRRDDLKGATWPAPKGADQFVKAITRVLFSPKQDVGLYTKILDGKVIWDVRASTLVASHGSYLKVGHYRATQSLTSIYRILDLGCFTTLKEGYDFLEIAAPGPGPVPVPTPIPPPSMFMARSSIQTGAELAVGTHDWTVNVTAGPLGKVCSFFVDGKLLRTVQPAQPVKTFAVVLELTGNEKTVGFTVTATDGQSRSFPAFPITVTKPAGPDLVRAKAQLQLGLTELRASSSYKQYKANGTLPGTHLGKSEAALAAALAALNG